MVTTFEIFNDEIFNVYSALNELPKCICITKKKEEAHRNKFQLQ